LPEGSFREMRLDPLEIAGEITFSQMVITGIGGEVLRRLPPEAVTPVNDIATLRVHDGAVTLVTKAGDPITTLRFSPALVLRASPASLWWQAARVWVVAFASTSALFFLIGRLSRHERLRALMASLGARPQRLIAAAAAVATLVSCYPVVFFGKSFLSPNNRVYLLYDSFPTLPGYEETTFEDSRGTDVGAVMWAHWPQSTLLHRALFVDHEWPLWNRYISAGSPLLGQGITTFGDPLQIPALLSGGAVWAWDFHYVAARWLFACGLGLAVWALVKSRGAALAVALSAPFIGFFAFRLNHPAYFTLCYAPWLLVGWLQLKAARQWGTCAAALTILVVTNLSLLASGALKEAVVQIGVLNALGLVLLCADSEETTRAKLRKLLAATVAGLGFALLTAPLWLTFVATLGKSWTVYEKPHVWQIDPRALVGLFDDLFYQQPWRSGLRWNPSLNFWLLPGVLWALADFAALPGRRFFGLIGSAALGCLALALRIVPETWITPLPFIGKIGHIDNCFSAAALVLLAVLAGAGWLRMASAQPDRRWRRSYAVMVALLLALLGLYLPGLRLQETSGFFKGYAAVIVAGALALPWLVRRWTAQPERRLGTAVWLLAICILLHARHGQHLNGAFDADVTNPQVRVNLKAPSPAVEYVRAHSATPARVIGLGFRLYQGYNQALLVETPFGIDPLHTVHFTELAAAFGINRVVVVDVSTPVESLSEDRRFYDLVNVRYYFGDAVAEPPAGSGLKVSARFDMGVFSSPDAWPRAFFSPTVQRVTGLDEFVRRVRSGDRRPFIAMENRDLAALGSGSATYVSRDDRKHDVVAATDFAFTTNTTAFDIRATGPGVVALHEAFVPGDFRVTLNGAPATVLRVNHAFKGVAVPAAGDYRIVFTYRPEIFSLALWLGAAGVGLLAAGAGLAYRRRAGVIVP
jgi:hypothetical protein